MTVRRRWTVEHTWTCSACGLTNKGRHLSCPKCGKPKGGEKYDESNATSLPPVTDSKVLAESRRGRNWKCGYCRYENRGDERVCSKCGSDPQASVSIGREAKKSELRPDVAQAFDDGVMSNEQMESLLRATSDGDYRTAPKYEPSPKKASPVQPSPPAAKKDADPDPYFEPFWTEERKRSYAIGSAIVVAISSLFGILTWLFVPWEESVHVTHRSWDRLTVLEQRFTLHGEGWDGDEPPSHFNDVCETRQHGTHDCNPYDCHPHSVSCNCHEVVTGESCSTHCSSGENGFSECEEDCSPTYSEECDSCTEYDTCYERCPTYDQWCTYDYYEWREVRRAATAGSGADPVVWPTLGTDLDPPSPQRIVRTESYRIEFRNDSDRIWTYEPPSETDYGHFLVGATWRIRVDHAGDVTPLHLESAPSP